MSHRNESANPGAARDDRETLLEIARQIAAADPDMPLNGSADDGDLHAYDTISSDDTPRHAPAIDEEHGVAERKFEAHPDGLALCSGPTIVRANTSFALAFGYPTAVELIEAGGLAAIFPGDLDRFAQPEKRNGHSSDARFTLEALTRSRRKVHMPLAIHDISGDGTPASLLVLHPDAEAGALSDMAEKLVPVAGDSPAPTLVARGDAPSGNAGQPPHAEKTVTENPERKRPQSRATGKKKPKPAARNAKADFLAKVSHEVRTPLNSIIGFAELMKEEQFGPIGNERYKNYIGDILDSGHHALGLINDLLDISRIESGASELNFTSVDVNDVIGECVRVRQGQAQIDRVFLRMSLAEDLPMVLADRRSLTQILLNLLSNAIRFTGPGGQVIVGSHRRSSGAVRIGVHDNGVGMSRDEIAQAMQPFHQLDTAPRKRIGSGLGLPLTKALVKANRAKFKLKSRPGSGTKVSLTFPADRTV